MSTTVTATEGLVILTLVTSIVSMILSCMALWPQWKDSLVTLREVRDTVLWMAVIAVLVGVVTVGWNRYFNLPSGPPATHGGTFEHWTAVDRR